MRTLAQAEKDLLTYKDRGHAMKACLAVGRLAPDGLDDRAIKEKCTQMKEMLPAAAEAFQAMLRPAVASTSSEGKSSDGGGGGGRGRRGEFSLEHTELHRQFSGIVEGHVEAFLSRQGSCSRALVDAIRRVEERSGSASASGGSGGAWALDASREIIDLLKEVDDFELWANNMLQKAENQRAAAMSSSSLLRK